MIVKKFCVLLICFAIFGNALAHNEPKDFPQNKNPVSEIKEKAQGLLNNLVREAEQFSLPINRISARTLVADLLWDGDEKQARIVFQNAVADLNLLIGQIPSDIPETEEETAERYAAITEVKSLRSELLLALAARDPQLALETMQILSRKTADGANFFEEDKTLELALAAQIAAKDPKQAYELARKNLETGLGFNLFSTLEDILKKDTELGTKLAQDILSKIKSRDTTVSSPYDSLSNGNQMMNSKVMAATSRSGGFVVNVWEIQTFLETIKKLNRQAVKDKKPTVLNDLEIKDLIEILAQKYVRQQYLSSYEVSKIMPDIIKNFPAQAQAIRAKIGQTETSTLNNLINREAFQMSVEDKSIDEILQIIEKKPTAERDDLYYQTAQKSFTDGDVQAAKKLYDKIKTRREYDYLDKQIDGALPLTLAQKGNLTEVRQMLNKLKSPEEKIEVLTELALTVARSGDQKLATALLNEARSMYAGRMKNRRNLAAILQLAQAFAVIEPDQSFSLLEANTSYFNDIISAAVLLDEFNDYGTIRDDEMRIEIVRAESYRNVPKAVQLIKNLSAADFNRTVNLADKFSRPEVRFFTRFRIAEALLDPKAEENEKNFQLKINEESYDH